MPLFGRLFDMHSYAAAFWIATALPLCGFVGWLVLSRESGSRGGDTRILTRNVAL
jgi:hypothetical protein